MSGIRLEKTGGFVTARFDKARGNAIDEPFTQELLDVAKQLGADPGVRGVLLHPSQMPEQASLGIASGFTLRGAT